MRVVSKLPLGFIVTPALKEAHCHTKKKKNDQLVIVMLSSTRLPHGEKGMSAQSPTVSAIPAQAPNV